MGSKTSSYVSTNEEIDNSNIQALGAARGDGNTVTVTDNEAIKDAFAFANYNTDGTSKTLGDVIGVFGSLANKAFESASTSTSDALKAASSSAGTLNSAIASATTKLQNNGIDPQMLLLVGAALLGFIIFKKG